MPEKSMATRSETLRRYVCHLRYGIDMLFLDKERPYLFIMVLNDACNLDCFYCESCNTGRYDMDFPTAATLLEAAYKRGNRILVITGGEPMCWKSGVHGLGDVVAVAKKLGFVDISIYTNGTFPLDNPFCRYIVTVDGTRETHNRIRQGTYDTVLTNAREASGDVIATITISKENAGELEQAVESISSSGVFRGISFNLLTHRPEIIEKFGLTGENRKDILDRLWKLRSKGHKIIFSFSTYQAMLNNNWKRPIRQIELGTRDNLFSCCRDVGSPEICDLCGYTSCVEISQALAWKPSAIMELLWGI
jgi:MoaA/NifB/PqqE/SkfB family radical SAM enzyme